MRRPFNDRTEDITADLAKIDELPVPVFKGTHIYAHVRTHRNS